MSTEDFSRLDANGDETGEASETQDASGVKSRPPPPTGRPSLQGITGVPGANAMRRSSALSNPGRGNNGNRQRRRSSLSPNMTLQIARLMTPNTASLN